MTTQHSEVRNRIIRVMNHIEAHLHENLSLEDLAAQACLSPFHFHRVFSATLGEAPLEYLRRLRLEKAAHALVYQGKRTLIDIALDHGYGSQEAFTRSFKRYWGVTPGQHRKAPKTTLRNSELLPPPAIPRGLEIRIVVLEAQEGLALRTWNGYGPHLFTLWDELCHHASGLGLLDGTAQYWGVSLDDPVVTPQDKCRYVACLVPGRTLPVPVPSNRSLFRYRLRPGTYVRVDFEGGAEDLLNAYRWFFCDWLDGQPWEPASSPPLELYRTNSAPQRTALHIPVTRRPVRPRSASRAPQ